MSEAVHTLMVVTTTVASADDAQRLAKVFLVQALGGQVWHVSHVSLSVVALYQQVVALLRPVAVGNGLNLGTGHVQLQGAGQCHAKGFVEDTAVYAGNRRLEDVGAG